MIKIGDQKNLNFLKNIFWGGFYLKNLFNVSKVPRFIKLSKNGIELPRKK
jgi:hypothetical protein